MAEGKLLHDTGEKKGLIIIALAWLILQIFLFYRFGIETGFEATKYITEAENLINSGHYTTGNFIFYSIQILLIAFAKLTGTFPWLPVLIQLLVNAFSVYLFYKLSYRFTLSYSGSLLFTLAFLAMFYYHLYNVYLFTESLYYSFGIIYCYYIFTLKKINFASILLLFLGLTLIYFTRPVGVFFVPATIIFIVLKFYRKSAAIILTTFGLAGIMVLYFLLNYALNSGGEFDFLLPYLDERIICGVPTIQGQHRIILPVEKDSIEGLWYIITHHTGLFIKLSIKRFLTFWGVVRPFYSLPHNIFIAAYFFTVYGLIIFKLKTLVKKYLPETAFFMTISGLVMITVMMSCDEWHNRFIFAILPFLLLMASVKTRINITRHA